MRSPQVANLRLIFRVCDNYRFPEEPQSIGVGTRSGGEHKSSVKSLKCSQPNGFVITLLWQFFLIIY